MKFTVTGADRETGEDIEMIVEAASSDEASAKANRRGIMVAACTTDPSSKRSNPPALGTSARPAAKTKPGSSSLVKAGILVAAIALTVVAVYFGYVKPRNEEITRTLNDAVKQHDQIAAMREKNDQTALDNLKKRAAQHGVNLDAPAAAPDTGDADRAAKQSLQRYLASAQPLVQEVKALRSRVASGASYNDFHEKFLLVADAYAQIEKPTEETVQLANAINDAVEMYERVDRQWMLAIKNNLWIAEKQRIREMLEQADGHVQALDAKFSQLKEQAR